MELPWYRVVVRLGEGFGSAKGAGAEEPVWGVKGRGPDPGQEIETRKVVLPRMESETGEFCVIFERVLPLCFSMERAEAWRAATTVSIDFSP